MKQCIKIAVCVIIVLICLLILVAKYDTWGVKPGAFDGHFSYFVDASDGGVSVFDVRRSYSGYFLFKNRFGRVVVAETTPESVVYRNNLTNAVYDKFGEVITYVRTIQPGIPTHLDFIGADNGSTTVFDLTYNLIILNTQNLKSYKPVIYKNRISGFYITWQVWIRN